MNIPSLRPFQDALLNPCADPIFKILFTNESKESNQALTSFLTDIIGKKVTNVVLQPNELSGESLTDKQSEFDINCRIDGKIVNIEMQGLNKDEHFGKRAEYHVAHLLNHYIQKGMDWNESLKAYQISVLNFVFDKGEAESINHYFMRNEKGRTVAKMLNIIFMELPKIERLPDDIALLTPAQMWGKFFLYASVPEKRDFLEQLTKANRGIAMAVTVLKNISQDEMNWYHETRYWMHVSDMKTMKNAAERRGLKEGRAKGLKEGRAEGRAEGLAEGKAEGKIEGARANAIENAKNLLLLNKLSEDEIARCCSLPLEQVLALKEKV